MGLELRDRFLGETRCVVCGVHDGVQHCYVIVLIDLFSLSDYLIDGKT